MGTNLYSEVFKNGGDKLGGERSFLPHHTDSTMFQGTIKSLVLICWYILRLDIRDGTLSEDLDVIS